MPDAFVEVNPFHAETLFPYHATLSRSSADVVLGHSRLSGQPIFDRIPARHEVASWVAFVRTLLRDRVRACHFNSVNVTLNPITKETVGLGIKSVALPILARLSGCRVTAIIHEADQFYATGLDSSTRARIYRWAVGRWLVKLFDTCYVLSPEVQGFLADRGIHTTLLDVSGLERFETSVPAGDDPSVSIAWIGPVVGYRRSWHMLTELQPDVMQSIGAQVSVLCDVGVGDGPQLEAALNERGLSPFFSFRRYRPDDVELFSQIRRSAGIFCLYGSEEYGATKTSGARIIARGMQKPYIANRPHLGLYRPDGSLLQKCETLQQAIQALVGWHRSAGSPVPRPETR